MNDKSQASGVQELIDRLRETGVEEGRARAEALHEDARRRADELLAEAHQEAEDIRRQARQDAERTRAAGEEAVRLAVRDALLHLKGEIVEHFSRQLRRLVAGTLDDKEFLRQLILEVARRAMPEQPPARLEVLLPHDVAGMDELRRKPEEVHEGTLSHFALSLGGEMVREGLTFRTAEDEASGIRVRLADEDVEIDLTDTAVSDLLLRHLLPRFRVLMEGVVK